MNSEIQKALFERVLLLPAQADLMGFPLFFPNVGAVPPGSMDYLEILHFPNSSIELTWNDLPTYQGILQINIYCAIGIGSQELARRTDAVVSVFPKAFQIIADNGATITIRKQPNVSTPVRYEGEFFQPVRIEYQASA